MSGQPQNPQVSRAQVQSMISEAIRGLLTEQMRQQVQEQILGYLQHELSLPAPSIGRRLTSIAQAVMNIDDNILPSLEDGLQRICQRIQRLCNRMLNVMREAGQYIDLDADQDDREDGERRTRRRRRRHPQDQYYEHRRRNRQNNRRRRRDSRSRSRQLQLNRQNRHRPNQSDEISYSSSEFQQPQIVRNHRARRQRQFINIANGQTFLTENINGVEDTPVGAVNGVATQNENNNQVNHVNRNTRQLNRNNARHSRLNGI